MKGSTKKPVWRTRTHITSILKGRSNAPYRQKKSDAQVEKEREKESADAWDEYDKHMRENTLNKIKDRFMAEDKTLSGKNSIEADTSKKQEVWKMHPELKKAIKNAIKASRAQIISTYATAIHPGKHGSGLNEGELNELHKKTLGRYIKKASHDVATKSAAVGRYAERANRVSDEMKNKNYKNFTQGKKDSETADKFFNKSWKRRKGIATAVDKLSK